MAALTGIKVICIGQFYFAPYASLLMARHGADVIKIEAPNGDPYRRNSSVRADGSSVQFEMINSGKRSLRLDLRSTEGQEVLRRLAGQADVVVQNLSPGALDRFGLGYVELSKLNPRLVMGSGTGYGSSGPYAGQPAMDLTIQARTGIMSTTGFADGPPVRTGPSVVDFMAGTHMFGGIVMALLERERTGRGQHVEVALQDAILPSIASNIAGMINSDWTMPERTGNRHGGLAVVPYNVYPTTDGWITLLCPSQMLWERLTLLMDDPATDDSRFETMDGRCADPDAVDEIVARWTSQFTKDEVAARLEPARIPNAPVVELAELLQDEHVQQRRIYRQMRDELGGWLTLSSPILLSGSADVEPTRAPLLGENTDEILGEFGMAPEEIGELRRAGVI